MATRRVATTSRLCTTVAGWLLASCVGAGRPAPRAAPPAAAAAPSAKAPGRPSQAQANAKLDAENDEPLSWKDATLSPRPGGAFDPADRELIAGCNAGDDALAAVAARVARRQSRGEPALDMADVSFALRAEGSPYVWPRAWTIEGTDLERGDVSQRIGRWLKSFDDGGQRRCGVARVRANDGHEVVAVVASDALADLAKLPTRVRAGQWIAVEARLLVPAPEAKVVVLGPVGPPRTVTASLSGGVVRSRFAADRPGPWVVQIVATVQVGPRPVAEAALHADEPPPTAFHARPAPGEEASDGVQDDRSAVERMVNRARAIERLSALSRDERLDRIAQAHAESMKTARRVGHDVGLGDAKARVEATGIAIRAAGENVSHAATLRRAHRALWASPSHRGNLLLPRFGALGIGVARDGDGSVWVCEVFADFGRFVGTLAKSFPNPPHIGLPCRHRA